MKADKTMIVDGVLYKPGDEIWDLGSFVATDATGMMRNYEGLSKDVSKLPHYVETVVQHFVWTRVTTTNTISRQIHGINCKAVMIWQ